MTLLNGSVRGLEFDFVPAGVEAAAQGGMVGPAGTQTEEKDHGPFRLDVSRTVQAVAVLLDSDPGKRMSSLRLSQLLYIADRECLAGTGRPITGDRIMALDFGPVLADVYRLLQSDRWEQPTWVEFFRKVGYQIERVKDPGVEALSEFAIRTLRDIADRYQRHGELDLVRLTQRLPEWQWNDPVRHGQLERPIPIEDVLVAVGRAKDIPWIMEAALADATLDQVLGR